MGFNYGGAGGGGGGEGTAGYDSSSEDEEEEEDGEGQDGEGGDEDQAQEDEDDRVDDMAGGVSVATGQMVFLRRHVLARWIPGGWVRRVGVEGIASQGG